MKKVILIVLLLILLLGGIFGVSYVIGQNRKDDDTAQGPKSITIIPGQKAAKKSSGKTNLRVAQSDVMSLVAGKGASDFGSVNEDELKKIDDELIWEDFLLSEDSSANAINLTLITPQKLVMQSREKIKNKTYCFFVELNVDLPTRYGSAIVDDDQWCPSDPGVPGQEFTTVQKDGWKT